MKRLTGSKKVFAIASAVFLVAAASGSALAKIDQGSGSVRSQPVQRQSLQNASGQTQQSPSSAPESHGNEGEFRGTVDVIAATGWVIGGRTVQVTGDTLVEVGIAVGSVVNVHAQRQADGSLVVGRIELVQNDGGDDNGNSNENENDNANGNVNSNDDGDDHDNDNGNVNSNDNDGGDDHDHSNGNSNSNDHQHDDNSGGSNNDNHGGDDHGGNGDD